MAQLVSAEDHAYECTSCDVKHASAAWCGCQQTGKNLVHTYLAQHAGSLPQVLLLHRPSVDIVLSMHHSALAAL